MSPDPPNESPPPESYPHPVQALLMRVVDQPMRVETIHLRNVGPGDVRVRIDQAGVCHSDLSLFRGVLAQPVPAVLGHEACGTVVETGAAITDLAEGQRVILLWITPCGTCFHCTHDEPHLCLVGAQRAAIPYAVTDSGEPVYPGLTVGAFAEQTWCHEPRLLRCPMTSARPTQPSSVAPSRPASAPP